MRFLVISESFAPANDPAADTARHIVDALVCAGHDLVLLTTGPGSDTYRGTAIIRTRAIFSAAAVRRAVTGLRPDSALVLTPRTMGAAAMRTLETLAVPMLVVDPTPLHPRTGRVLASSESSARILAAGGVRSTLWRLGVRTDEHHPGLRDPALRDRWARVGRPGGDLTVVGYVGVVKHAGTSSTRRLAAVAAIPGVRLVVAGTGPGAAVLKEAGAKILGPTNGLETARAIASFDLLVQPRKTDMNLSSVRKALASGVPVVAFATGSAREVVTDRETGLLVQPGTGGIAAAVMRLVNDEALRSGLAANARSSVSGRTWDDAVAELVAHCAPASLAG